MHNHYRFNNENVKICVSRSMSSNVTKDIQQGAKTLHREFFKTEINTDRCKLN
jgi:hypothetical protein